MICIDPDNLQKVVARFMSNVDQLQNGCWYWQGARSRGAGNKKWYGSFRVGGKVVRAHRFACDVIGGKTCGPGEHRDHVCGFSMCVNPAHIEIVSREENQRRKVERISLRGAHSTSKAGWTG